MVRYQDIIDRATIQTALPYPLVMDPPRFILITVIESRPPFLSICIASARPLFQGYAALSGLVYSSLFSPNQDCLHILCLGRLPAGHLECAHRNDTTAKFAGLLQASFPLMVPVGLCSQSLIIPYKHPTGSGTEAHENCQAVAAMQAVQMAWFHSQR